MPEEANISWDCPKIREVEREWQSLQETYDKPVAEIPGRDGKDNYIEMQKMTERLLRKRLSEQELHQLAVSCDKLPVRIGECRFIRDVLALLVKCLVGSRDRETLVRLLSARCPSQIDPPENIEFYLAFHGKELKDPILVLSEAYSQCEVPETRHSLAAGVRRGFAGLGIRGKDDADYVKNAMQWYEKEKDHLVANWAYTMNETASPFSVDAYEKHPELYDNPGGFTRYPLFERK